MPSITPRGPAIQRFLHATKAMAFLAPLGLKHRQLIKSAIPRGCASAGHRELQVHQVRSRVRLFSVSANQDFSSRDIHHYKPDARPGPDRAQLRSADRGADRRAGGPGRRPRPAGLGADRLGQDRRLWARDRPTCSATPSGSSAAAAPLALIVAPTRELALQVQRELAWLYQYADARVVSCVGGMDPRAEAAPTGRGRPHRGRHARPAVRSFAARPPRRLAA